MKFMAIFLLCLFISHTALLAHCQIPCGIFEDKLRFSLMMEHVATIEKSMKQIKEISSKEEKDFNQLVRWIQNKEKHAEELSGIVTYYFMAQRVKPVENKESKEYADYLKKIVLLHQILILSMKSKQTLDLTLPEKIRGLIKEFENAYFEHEKKQDK